MEQAKKEMKEFFNELVKTVEDLERRVSKLEETKAKDVFDPDKASVGPNVPPLPG